MKKWKLLVLIAILLLLYMRGESYYNGKGFILSGVKEDGSGLIVGIEPTNGIPVITNYCIIREDDAIYLEIFTANCFILRSHNELTKRIIIENYKNEKIYILTKTGKKKLLWDVGWSQERKGVHQAIGEYL